MSHVRLIMRLCVPIAIVDGVSSRALVSVIHMEIVLPGSQLMLELARIVDWLAHPVGFLCYLRLRDFIACLSSKAATCRACSVVFGVQGENCVACTEPACLECSLDATYCTLCDSPNGPQVEIVCFARSPILTNVELILQPDRVV